MIKTYRITTYGDTTYTVSIDDGGVVDIDGLPPTSAEIIKASVSRHIERRGLPAVTALGLAVGSYATVELANDTAVADSL